MSRQMNARQVAAASPADFPVAASAPARAETPAAAIEQAVVNLSTGTWVKAGGTLGTIVMAAVGWANSLQAKIDTANSNLTTAIAKVEFLTEKLSTVTGELKGLSHRFERLEDRLESLESGARVKSHKTTAKDNSDG